MKKYIEKFSSYLTTEKTLLSLLALFFLLLVISSGLTLSGFYFWIALFIQSVFLIIAVILIISPFLILRKDKFKPLKWWYFIFAYLISISVFVFMALHMGDFGSWVYYNIKRWFFIERVFDNVGVQIIPLMIILLSLSPFYVLKLLYGKFTRLRFYVTLSLSLLIFIILVVAVFYAVAWALGQIGSKYF